jgi:hypothetical protein
MNSEKYIGLDVHQATISVAALDSTGKLVMESILRSASPIPVTSSHSTSPSTRLRLAHSLHRGHHTTWYFTSSTTPTACMQIVLKRGTSGYPCPQLRHEPSWLLIDAPATAARSVSQPNYIKLGVFQEHKSHTIGGSLRVSFQPNSCSANQTANAATRSGDVRVSRYLATASIARCLRSSNIPTDYHLQRLSSQPPEPSEWSNP